MSDANVTMERLEDQINWYDRCSMNDQQYFKWMKAIVILAAALIPFLSGTRFPILNGSLAGLASSLLLSKGFSNSISFRLIG